MKFKTLFKGQTFTLFFKGWKKWKFWQHQTAKLQIKIADYMPCTLPFFSYLWNVIMIVVNKILCSEKFSEKLRLGKNNVFVAEFPSAFQNNRDKLDRGPRLHWGVNQRILPETQRWKGLQKMAQTKRRAQHIFLQIFRKSSKCEFWWLESSSHILHWLKFIFMTWLFFRIVFFRIFFLWPPPHHVKFFSLLLFKSLNWTYHYVFKGHKVMAIFSSGGSPVIWQIFSSLLLNHAALAIAREPGEPNGAQFFWPFKLPNWLLHSALMLAKDSTYSTKLHELKSS